MFSTLTWHAKAIAALALTVIVGGCTGAPSGPSTTELLSQAYSACSSASKSRGDEAKCFTSAEDRLMSDFPDPDLLRYKQALRLSLAEKVDKGTMTQTDADLEYSKGMSQIMSEFKSRSSSRQMVDAQYETARSVRNLKPSNPCIVPNQKYCFGY